MLNESNLYHYQQVVIKAILEKKRILVNQEMGLGKTIAAITAFTKALHNS